MAPKSKGSTVVDEEVEPDAEPEAEEADEEAEEQAAPADNPDEVGPVLPAGHWVRLADVEGVPEEVVGHIAAITQSPWTPIPFGGSPDEVIHGWRYDEATPFIVETRDEYGLIFQVTEDAFQKVAETRNMLTGHA